VRRLTLITVSLVWLFTRHGVAIEPPTMRVDYYHTGNATEERFSLDRIVVEPLPWPGNPAKPLDDTNRGKYFFEVTDAATGQPIFSRGFASIYGEWETTAEAKKMNRTFSESLRFPLVDKPVRIVVKKRDARNAFVEAWSFSVDPNDKFVERGAAAVAAGPLLKFHARVAILRPSSTCWCCATATPRASEESSSAMPGGSLRRCSRRRRSRSVRETSTSGDFVRHHSSPG
jgi:hypothetical protein